MEIYNNDNKTTNTYKDNLDKKPFFPRSDLNDWTPIWEKIVFFVLGFIGIRLFSSLITRIIYVTPLVTIKDGIISLSLLGSVLINFFTYLLLVLSFCGLIFLDKRKTYKRIFFDFKKKETYLWALIGFGLVLGYQLALGNLFSATIPFYGSNANESGIEAMAKQYPILLFIMTVFFAPFVEELTYRVGLVDTFGHKYNLRWLGIILSAILFGLIHADISGTYYSYMTSIALQEEAATIEAYKIAFYNELLNLPIYIGSGFFLGLTYAKSGKIASSMVAHLSVNLFSMISLFIQNAIAK